MDVAGHLIPPKSSLKPEIGLIKIAKFKLPIIICCVKCIFVKNFGDKFDEIK